MGYRLEADALYALQRIAIGSSKAADFWLSTFGAPRLLERKEFDEQRELLWADQFAEVLRRRMELARSNDIRDQEQRRVLGALPKLRGTEKQIAWASDLRRAWALELVTGFAAQVEAEERGIYADRVFRMAPDRYAVSAVTGAGGDTPEGRGAIIDAVKKADQAKFWIDNRGGFSTVLDAVMKAAEPVPEEEIVRIAATARRELEAKAEATLSPEDPDTTILTEITLDGKELRVKSEAYIEGLGDVLKPLGFAWDKDARRWSRKLGALSDDPIDRIAETAAKLVDAGMPALTWDEEARRRVVANSWKPEIRKWIHAYIGKKGSTKFGVVYPYDENHYEQARRLRGAEYVSSGFFKVPVSSYEEIVDFAEQYGFGFTPGARQLIDAARAADGHRITVAPAIPEIAVAASMPDVPLPLAVPTDVTIDPDLLDDAAA